MLPCCTACRLLQCDIACDAATWQTAKCTGAADCFAPTNIQKPPHCCHCRLHELDASVCAQQVAQAFHSLLPQLCAQQEGVRFGTQQALKNLINDCMDEAMIQTAVSQGSMRSTALPPAQNIVLAVANMLTVRYQDGWINALSGLRPRMLYGHALLMRVQGELVCVEKKTAKARLFVVEL